MSLLLPTHRNEVQRRREVTSQIQVHKSEPIWPRFFEASHSVRSGHVGTKIGPQSYRQVTHSTASSSTLTP